MKLSFSDKEDAVHMKLDTGYCLDLLSRCGVISTYPGIRLTLHTNREQTPRRKAMPMGISLAHSQQRARKVDIRY